MTYAHSHQLAKAGLVGGCLLAASAPSAEDLGRIVFTYDMQETGLCTAGSEVLLRATLRELPVTLGLAETIGDRERDCSIVSRRGTDVTRMIIPCSEESLAAKKAKPRVDGVMGGELALCQSGYQLRLIESAVDVALSGDQAQRISIDLGKNEAKRGFASYFRHVFFSRSVFWKDEARDEAGFLSVQVKEVLKDVTVQNPSLLPTDDVYGIRVRTPIKVAFGDPETN